MPTDDRALIIQFYIEIDGAPLASSKMNDLYEVEVDVALHLPGTATLKFYSHTTEWVDDPLLDLGKTVTIKVKDALNQNEVLFKGIITNLEPEFIPTTSYGVMVVRAYDKSYGMHRGTRSAAYVQMSDADIVSQIAGDNGLSVQVESTSVVNEHVYRNDQSDYAFVSMLARRNGYVAFYDSPSDKLLFRAPKSFPNVELKCEYGKDLLEFRPRLALGGQVSEVKIHGWNAADGKVVAGRAASPQFTPTKTQFGSRGPALANKAFGSSKTIHLSQWMGKQGAADKTAQSVFDRMASTDLTAEGVSLGNGKLQPGVTLNVSAVGRYSGSYFITRTRHLYTPTTNYTTEVWMGGMHTGTFAALLNDDPRSPLPPGAPKAGLMRAIVTDSQDPANMGRVALKFPTLDDQLQSWWASVASPGAGRERGLMLIPEVNDEVLVGFLEGDFDRPVVLGGLWNTTDKMPEAQSKVVVSGTVNIREWKSRTGHFIRLTDEAGQEKIEIVDKTGNNLIAFDSSQNTIKVSSAKDIVIEAKGNVNIKGVNINIEGQAKVVVGAPVVEAEGKTQIALKGGMAELSASGITKISGSMVNIN